MTTKESDSVLALMAEWQAQVAAEAEEIRRVIGDDVHATVLFHETLPDGSRVYYLALPVKEECRESKGGWERMVVHCANVQGTNRVDYAITYYTNGASHSFPKEYDHPTNQVRSDEAALWEVVRWMYHDY